MGPGLCRTASAQDGGFISLLTTLCFPREFSLLRPRWISRVISQLSLLLGNHGAGCEQGVEDTVVSGHRWPGMLSVLSSVLSLSGSAFPIGLSPPFVARFSHTWVLTCSLKGALSKEFGSTLKEVLEEAASAGGSQWIRPCAEGFPWHISLIFL